MMRRLLLLLAVLANLLSLGGLAPSARAADPIAPEQAFAMRARALDAQTVEVVFTIAKGYYLYGNKFRFEAEPEAVRTGTADKPPGQLKQDPYFGEVETHRGELRLLLPVEAPAGSRQFTLTAISQGCWDGGICYPPTRQQAAIDLDAPPQTALGAGPSGGLAARLGAGLPGGLTARFSAGAPPAPGPQSLTETGTETEAAATDESGRIAGLLQGAGVPLILASFFGFGLLLAFTPCTFPMIPILSGIIVGHGQALSRMRALMLSLAYVLGMAVT